MMANERPARGNKRVKASLAFIGNITDSSYLGRVHAACLDKQANVTKTTEPAIPANALLVLELGGSEPLRERLRQGRTAVESCKACCIVVDKVSDIPEAGFNTKIREKVQMIVFHGTDRRNASRVVRLLFPHVEASKRAIYLPEANKVADIAAEMTRLAETCVGATA